MRTLRIPFGPSTKLRMVSLPNHKLRADMSTQSKIKAVRTVSRPLPVVAQDAKDAKET